MLATPPAEILLHDAVHDRGIRRLELESHGERDIALLVERARIIPELHVLAINGPSLAIMRQQLRRFEYLGNEHGALARGGRREEMKILPDRAAYRARNTNIMFEPGEPSLHRLRNEPGHHGSALYPQSAMVEEFQVARRVPDDESAKALVADEDVGAEAQHEIIDAELSGGGDRPCQIVGRCCIVEQIGWTADPECGVLTERLFPFESLRIHATR